MVQKTVIACKPQKVLIVEGGPIKFKEEKCEKGGKVFENSNLLKEFLPQKPELEID